MLSHIFRWNGKHFGFIYAGKLFDAKSNYVGWVEKDGKVWSSNGNLLGELVDGEYILRNQLTIPPIPRIPRIPPIPPVPPIPPIDRIGRIGKIGWVDGLNLL